MITELANTKKMDGETLVREYITTRSQQKREMAIEAFLPMVKYIVGRININDNGLISKEDAYQYGIIGLMDALERYQPEYGVVFKTFAYKRIRGEILDALCKEGVLNKDQLRDLTRLSSAREKLTAILDREPLPQEIWEEAEVTEDRFYQIQRLNELNFIMSLDDPVAMDENGSITRKDTIPDASQVPPDITLEQDGLKVELKKIIQELPERQRLILALYYYEELTLFDVGQVLGISESRVSQLLNQTVKEIRKKLNI